MSDSVPIACDPSALNEEERAEHQQNAEAVLGSVREACEQPDGYAFRLPTGSETIRRAAAFVARERLCCPFFDFTLTVERDQGPVWLTLTGREGVKAYVESSVLPTIRKAQAEAEEA